ncbi:MAG: hypothetical protein NDF55_10870 [archaeon GB-1867-005]|nr:hypothetical protein [Candidatus Culexmicrobium cathedralense]
MKLQSIIANAKQGGSPALKCDLCNEKAEYVITLQDGKVVRLCSKHLIEKLNKGDFAQAEVKIEGSCPKCEW